MAHIIMDVLTLLIIALFAFLGWRKGFFRSLVNVVGSIVLYLIAFFASKIASPILYTKFLGPYFTEKIELYIRNVGEGVRIESVIINALSKIPKFCKNRLLQGIETEQFVEEIKKLAGNEVDKVGEIMVYDYIPRVLIPLMQGILFILLLLLLFFLLRSLILLLGNHASKRGLIGRVDAVIGCICGAVLGIVIMLVFGFVAELIIGFTSDTLSWCSTAVIDRSLLFRWIYSIVEAGLVVSVG